MSFAANETSTAQATRVRMVVLSCGAKTWRYSNASELINIGGELFDPLEGLDLGVEPSESSFRKMSAVLKVPEDIELVSILKLGVPNTEVVAQFISGHIGSPDVVTTFSGRITNYKIVDPMAELTVESFRSASARSAVTQVITTRCPIPLYEVGSCNVDKNAFRADGEVSAVAGLTVTIPAFAARPAGWFVGGYLEWWDAELGINIVRDIEESNGVTVVVASAPVKLAAGTAVKAYPGCNHQWQGDCINKFNNALNCRAMPFMNELNPFAGSSLY